MSPKHNASLKSPMDAAMYRAGKSGRDLAASLKVSEHQVSRWRNGLKPTKPMRGKIAQRLGVKAEELWP